MSQHRHQEWIKFLKQIDAETPAELDLHLIVDNYATHKQSQSPIVVETASTVPYTLHSNQYFWLNLVERWFREITDNRHSTRHVSQR